MDSRVFLGSRLRLEQYLDPSGSYLWDCRQRASFATYTLGLRSERPRKSVEPIAALFTSDLLPPMQSTSACCTLCATRPGPITTCAFCPLAMRWSR